MRFFTRRLLIVLASVEIVSFFLSHLDFHITQQLGSSLKFSQALSSAWREPGNESYLHYHTVFYLSKKWLTKGSNNQGHTVRIQPNT